jgi:hypothetical protein
LQGKVPDEFAQLAASFKKDAQVDEVLVVVPEFIYGQVLGEELQVFYGEVKGAFDEALFFYADPVDSAAVKRAYVGGGPFQYFPYGGKGVGNDCYFFFIKREVGRRASELALFADDGLIWGNTTSDFNACALVEAGFFADDFFVAGFAVFLIGFFFVAIIFFSLKYFFGNGEWGVGNGAANFVGVLSVSIDNG